MNTHDYQLALDPALQLSTEEFVSAWNGSPDSRALAEAKPEKSGVTYDPFAAAACVVLVVVGTAALAAGKELLGDELKEKIKSVLKGVLERDKSGSQGRRQLDIVQLDRPDGTRVLVVRQIEG